MKKSIECTRKEADICLPPFPVQVYLLVRSHRNGCKGETLFGLYAVGRKDVHVLLQLCRRAAQGVNGAAEHIGHALGRGRVHLAQVHDHRAAFAQAVDDLFHVGKRTGVAQQGSAACRLLVAFFRRGRGRGVFFRLAEDAAAGAVVLSEHTAKTPRVQALAG